MIDSKKMLGSILKTAQMGQTGIRCIRRSEMTPGLEKAVVSQYKEYDSIEKEAMNIAEKRGWELSGLSPSVWRISEKMAKLKFIKLRDHSGIAEKMIQGNMRGMIKGCRNLNHLKDSDTEIAALANKLIETEKQNIQQMQKYL